jgi:gluconate 2-dehydrogenase alpha chain
MQPAGIVVPAFTPHNTRLLLLSSIGEPYDPVTGKGTLGKNLPHQVTSGSRAWIIYNERLNAFITSGAVGLNFADFDGDRALDPSSGILRGGTFGRGTSPSGLPIGSFGRIPPGKRRATRARSARRLPSACGTGLDPEMDPAAILSRTG